MKKITNIMIVVVLAITMFLGTIAARPLPAPSTITAENIFYGDTATITAFVPKAPTGKQAPFIEVVCQNADSTINNILRNLNIVNNPDGSANISTEWTPSNFNETVGATCSTTLNMYNSKSKSFSPVATDDFEVSVAQKPLLILAFDPNKYEYAYGEDIYFTAVTTFQIADPDVDVVCTNGDFYSYDFTESRDAEGNYVYTSALLTPAIWEGEPPQGECQATLSSYDGNTGVVTPLSIADFIIYP